MAPNIEPDSWDLVARHAIARSPSYSSKPNGTADTGELEDWLAFRDPHLKPLEAHQR